MRELLLNSLPQHAAFRRQIWQHDKSQRVGRETWPKIDSPHKNISPIGHKGVIESLKAVDARLVFYDERLTNAQQAYGDYLEEHAKVDKLWGGRGNQRFRTTQVGRKLAGLWFR